MSDVQTPWVAAANAQPAPKNEWGPRGWAWLHSEAIAFPANPTNSERVEMFTRFWSFVTTLPCEECRGHATAYSRKYPPDFSGSAGFQTWAWRFHNAVNKRLGHGLMIAEDYRKTYAEEISKKNWRYVR